MKIFYIGKFLNDWNTESYVAYALKENNVTVFKRPYTSTGSLDSYISQIESFGPDVVLFSKSTSPCFKELIDWCKSRKILTVCWLWDLYWGYRTSRPIQFFCDLLLTTDGGHDDLWSKHGINHRVLRQGIHLPDHQIYEPEYEFDVGFIGTTNSYKQRKDLTKWLFSNYTVSTHHATRGLSLNKCLAKIKIIVGDSYPCHWYWSNRVYEILGRGGFLLFPETPGLEKEFTDEVHYVSYRRGDYHQLAKLIEYYKEHDEEREKIRRAGFEECEKYSYTSRVRELLKIIDEYRLGSNMPQACTANMPFTGPSLHANALQG